jgi:hypothetical protein
MQGWRFWILCDRFFEPSNDSICIPLVELDPCEILKSPRIVQTYFRFLSN